MKYVSKDGVKIYYKKLVGKKTPIVFIHGLSGEHESLKNQYDLFKNHTRILIDLRGHGKSDKPRDKSSYEIKKLISDVKGIIKKEKIKNYFVVGFSLGGLIASQLNAKKTILINPVFSKKDWKVFPLFEIWISRFIPRFLIKFFEKEKNVYKYRGLLDAYATKLIRTPAYVYWNIILNLNEFEGVFPKHKYSLIKSNKDEIIKNKFVGEFSLFKIKGHHSVMCENPKAVNKILKEILSD